MKPRGPLMIEHRLIEKMFQVTREEMNRIKEKGDMDPVFIDTIVDFVRTYADRTHHGKEEDILFKALEEKDMNEEDSRVMKELVNEHVQARKVVGQLVTAKEEYVDGKKDRIDTVVDKLDWLITFYPKHIDKEDNKFFPDSEKYFSEDELNTMLEDFWEFDRQMIHEKYNKLYESLAKR